MTLARSPSRWQELCAFWMTHSLWAGLWDAKLYHREGLILCFALIASHTCRLTVVQGNSPQVLIGTDVKSKHVCTSHLQTRPVQVAGHDIKLRYQHLKGTCYHHQDSLDQSNEKRGEDWHLSLSTFDWAAHGVNKQLHEWKRN